MGNSNCDKCGHDTSMCECDKLYVAQEGGDHYQAKYQHWDWVSDIGMGYLPGNCTKYVARWKNKNGLADLRKAMTYLDKMLAIRKNDDGYKFNREASYKTRVCTDRFTEANKLAGAERSICEILTGPCEVRMIMLAKEFLRALIMEAEKAVRRQQAGAAPNPYGVAPMPPQAPSPDVSGRAGGIVGQAPASSASVGGMEHPFGYDETLEGYPERPEVDFTNHRRK